MSLRKAQGHSLSEQDASWGAPGSSTDATKAPVSSSVRPILNPVSVPPSNRGTDLPPSSYSGDRIPPSSIPSSRSLGGIHRLVTRVDERYGSFFISRLILMTGIKLRSYEAFTPDDPELVRRLLQALSTLIPPDEVGDLLAMLPTR